jgi:prolyl-tRNA synthetase
MWVQLAPIQVIICPISMKNVDYGDLLKYCEDIKYTLKKRGVRIDLDSRQNYTPGWKFNHWEQKGVPIRIEVGPRDLTNKQVLFAFITYYCWGGGWWNQV